VPDRVKRLQGRTDVCFFEAVRRLSIVMDREKAAQAEVNVLRRNNMSLLDTRAALEIQLCNAQQETEDLIMDTELLLGDVKEATDGELLEWHQGCTVRIEMLSQEMRERIVRLRSTRQEELERERKRMRTATDDMRRELDALKEKLTPCCVCKEVKSMCMQARPCKHLVCASCFEQQVEWPTCPICRAGVNEWAAVTATVTFE